MLEHTMRYGNGCRPGCPTNPCIRDSMPVSHWARARLVRGVWAKVSSPCSHSSTCIRTIRVGILSFHVFVLGRFRACFVCFVSGGHLPAVKRRWGVRLQAAEATEHAARVVNLPGGLERLRGAWPPLLLARAGLGSLALVGLLRVGLGRNPVWVDVISDIVAPDLLPLLSPIWV